MGRYGKVWEGMYVYTCICMYELFLCFVVCVSFATLNSSFVHSLSLVRLTE